MVLFYLRKRGPHMAVTELAEEIAARENDIDVESLTYKQRKRVHVSLYQTHLPKLADAEVIRYDKNDGKVELTDRATEIDAYLTATSVPEYPWQKHYLSLAALSGLVLLAHLAAVPAFETIPANVLSVIVTLAFGTSAVAQFVMSRQDREELSLELCEDSL